MRVEGGFTYPAPSAESKSDGSPSKLPWAEFYQGFRVNFTVKGVRDYRVYRVLGYDSYTYTQ